MKKAVPFFANTTDDTHCFQAGIRMILKYFLPERDFSWEELDQMTAKEPGMWTWANAGIIALSKMGFDLKVIEDFDSARFGKEGVDYLKEIYGEEVTKEQEKHSNIPREQELMGDFLKLGINEVRIPTIEDIKLLIDRGYLVACNVNSQKLNDKEGYVGHFIVIYDYDDTGFTFHDPGLPPQEARQVDYNKFESAWAFPNDKAKNVLGVYLNNNARRA